MIDNKDAPVPGLGPDDFEVTISGRPRRVVKAEWLTYGTRAGQPGSAGRAPPPTTRRMACARAGMFDTSAIDEESFQPTGAIAARAAVERFIDKLRPDDRVGVYAVSDRARRTSR